MQFKDPIKNGVSRNDWHDFVDINGDYLTLEYATLDTYTFSGNNKPIIFHSEPRDTQQIQQN